MNKGRLIALSILTMVLGGCAHDDGKAEIDAFRSELADPARFPLRRGDKLDDEAMRQACMQFARSHRDRFDGVFRRSIAELPDAELPTPPAFRQFCVADPQDLQAVEQQAFVWALHPEPEAFLRFSMSFLVPMALQASQESRADLGRWMGFLNLARPKLGKRWLGDDLLALIADYGGLDVLVMQATRGDVGWSVKSFAWWRPAS